jgi:hypothetical protein
MQQDNFSWYDPRLVTVLVICGLFALSGIATSRTGFLILAVSMVVGFLLVVFSIYKTEEDAEREGRRIEW